jgi:PA14 domain
VRRAGRRRPFLCLLAAVVGWATIAVALALGRAGDGLAGQYFENTTWTPPLAFSTADTAISTETLNRRWRVTPPVFSARWTGYLTVGETRDYTFAIRSDDGARLFIDNRLVVDNDGTHEAVTRSGVARLGRGSHLVEIDYVQAGGRYVLEWWWSVAGADAEAVPPWMLSRRPVSWGAAQTARVLDWLWWIAAAVVVGCASWSIRRLPTGTGTRLRGRQLQILSCLALFVCLAVLETWPLASDPGHLSRNDNADTVLNEWTIAWVAHQAVHDPSHLFQANIFHPEPDSLAFSESLLVQSAIAAPVLWAGGSPVLAYNLVLIAGFALTGFALCLVVARWTGDWGAGVAAGVVIAFNGHTLARLPHLQALHVEFLPLALLALDRLLRQPRVRHAASLAGWFALQALCSYYLFVMTIVALAAALLARPASWRGRRGLAVTKFLAVAAGLASLVVLPYLLPYWRVHRAHGMSRSIADMIPAVWPDYLTTGARFDQWLLRGWGSEAALFPGFVALALAAYALARGALADPRARMCAVLGAVGIVVSFGASVPGFSLLYLVFPPLQGIRALSRFGYLGIVAVAVLSGFGVAAIGRHARRSAFAAVAAVVVPILLIVESLAAPIRYQYESGIPPIYHRLDADRSAVVAELPLAPHNEVFANAPAMLHSTTSFYRLLNGYSGFTPLSYFHHYDALAGFPAPEAIAALQRYGVTHVFVHTDSFSAEQVERLRTAPGLRLIAEERSVALFEVSGDRSDR